MSHSKAMSAAFTITVDPERCFLEMTLSGFFNLADVERYAAERAVAFRRLGCPPGVHVTLSDVRDCAILSQDVLAAFSRITNDPRYRARKVAFLTGMALARRQAQRMADGDRVRCFEDEAAAQAWLFEATAAAA